MVWVRISATVTEKLLLLRQSCNDLLQFLSGTKWHRVGFRPDAYATQVIGPIENSECTV